MISFILFLKELSRRVYTRRVFRGLTIDLLDLVGLVGLLGLLDLNLAYKSLIVSVGSILTSRMERANWPVIDLRGVYLIYKSSIVRYIPGRYAGGAGDTDR